jgi:hypothetical protein
MTTLPALTLAIAVTVTPYLPANKVGSMMLPVIPGVTCAVSRDLAHLKGKWVHVKGWGIRFVNDVTHARLRRRVDLAVRNMDEAREVNLQKSEVTVERGEALCKKATANARKTLDVCLVKP